MADYKQVLHERLHLKVPGTDKLRKTAAARLKHLLAAGWRETQRTQHPDHLEVRLERTGHAPMRARLPRVVPEVRFERRPRSGGRFGAPGGRGGGRGFGGGRGRGAAPRGAPAGAAPGSAPGSAPGGQAPPAGSQPTPPG